MFCPLPESSGTPKDARAYSQNAGALQHFDSILARSAGHEFPARIAAIQNGRAVDRPFFA
ncbi:hypothetical protein ASZ90_003021 [hydrocarbon metagenome]|uniref:Uncharacterized protein n=1 Tax=hydrocarbon metagenome TaxID=938273 RepID=A0A0W8G1Z5_9ZZZZ